MRNQNKPSSSSSSKCNNPKLTRVVKCHGSRSTHSGSIHPDEDWTKITDLAQRRRIQNRIAQRNYRKKLKRRMIELETNMRINAAATSSSSVGQMSFDLQCYKENNQIGRPQMPAFDHPQVPVAIDMIQLCPSLYGQEAFLTPPPTALFPGYQPQLCIPEQSDQFGDYGMTLPLLSQPVGNLYQDILQESQPMSSLEMNTPKIFDYGFVDPCTNNSLPSFLPPP